MSDLTKQINIIVNNTDPYHKGEILYSLYSIISLIVKECLIKIKVL